MATPHERLGVSRKSVDRAGQLLRVWYESGLLADVEVQRASTVLNDYRSQIKDPLKRVVMGLRSAVRTAGADVIVSERLKRQPRIIDKLIRFPRMELTYMNDTGRGVSSELQERDRSRGGARLSSSVRLVAGDDRQDRARRSRSGTTGWPTPRPGPA